LANSQELAAGKHPRAPGVELRPLHPSLKKVGEGRPLAEGQKRLISIGMKSEGTSSPFTPLAGVMRVDFAPGPYFSSPVGLGPAKVLVPLVGKFARVSSGETPPCLWGRTSPPPPQFKEGRRRPTSGRGPKEADFNRHEKRGHISPPLHPSQGVMRVDFAPGPYFSSPVGLGPAKVLGPARWQIRKS